MPEALVAVVVVAVVGVAVVGVAGEAIILITDSTSDSISLSNSSSLDNSGWVESLHG